MKTFRINTQEIYDVVTEVEADTLEEAIRKAKGGDGEQLILEYNRQYQAFEPKEAAPE